MDKNEKRDRDRVFISAEVHDLYKRLTAKDAKDGQGQKDLENAPFATMKDVFMWAAAIGVQLGRRKSLAGAPTEHIFFWSTFSELTDIPLLQAVAVAATDSLDVLGDRGEVLRIAEEYANAGIYELQARLLEDYRVPLWQLVEMMMEADARTASAGA